MKQQPIAMCGFLNFMLHQILCYVKFHAASNFMMPTSIVGCGLVTRQENEATLTGTVFRIVRLSTAKTANAERRLVDCRFNGTFRSRETLLHEQVNIKIAIRRAKCLAVNMFE